MRHFRMGICLGNLSGGGVRQRYERPEQNKMGIMALGSVSRTNVENDFGPRRSSVNSQILPRLLCSWVSYLWQV